MTSQVFVLDFEPKQGLFFTFVVFISVLMICVKHAVSDCYFIIEKCIILI
jgi:hypothetical protein